MKKLLIVDDEECLLTLLSLAFKETNIHVLTACNATEALFVVKEELPGLVLCDVNLPDTDGFEFCRQVQKSDLPRVVQFVFMSGMGTPWHLHKAQQLGALAYILKPFEIVSMRQQILLYMQPPGE